MQTLAKACGTRDAIIRKSQGSTVSTWASLSPASTWPSVSVNLLLPTCPLTMVLFLEKLGTVMFLDTRIFAGSSDGPTGTALDQFYPT